MGTAIKQRLWALGAALSLLICVPLVKPWLDMGTIGDDTSYTRTAQLLAETGHIIYNGWATAHAGLAALLGRLVHQVLWVLFRCDTDFDASSGNGRCVSIPAQHGAGRADGVECHPRDTDDRVVAAIFAADLQLHDRCWGFLRHSDVFLSCLRALQAETNTQACWWIAFAAISNGVGGTVRQTGWLGLLIIDPGDPVASARTQTGAAGCGVDLCSARA